jgi:hypothetical protein
MSRSTLFWGLLLIIIGGILLLDNLGILGDISVWSIIWPLVLIAIGGWILWGSFFRRGVESEQVSLPLEGAQRAEIKLQHGAGRLIINANAPEGTLLEGVFGGGLNLSKSRQGDLISVRMSPDSFAWFPGSTLDWRVALSNDVPLSINMDSGASDARLDFSELQLKDLYLKSGASSTVLTLPSQAGFTRARIESGAASVDIRIPEGVAASIRWRGGLSSLNVDRNRFSRQGDVYQSDDYAEAVNKIDLDIQMGVGSVTVR